MAKNNKSGSRRRHIDTKYLAIRERVKEKKVVIEHFSTELMIADPLTKGMPPLKFKESGYASAVGSLMYAQVCTRLDIALVEMLGRYQSNLGVD